MNIEKKVFQLIISVMLFVVPVYGQHSELLSQYRDRALQYNQDMYLQPIVTQYLVCNKSEIWP